MRTAKVIQITANTFTYPAGHPEGPGFGTLFMYAVDDGSDVYLVDTGIGVGHAWIDAHYKPSPFDTLASLHNRRIEKSRIKAIICSHMHFDHCGNNRLFPGIPIYVQRVELMEARQKGYTVPEWIEFPGAEYHELEGSQSLSEHIEVIATPGHTAGHQSVVVAGTAGLTIIVAQAAYTAAEFSAHAQSAPPPNRHDAWSSRHYEESLRRLHALDPIAAYFSHDENVWRRGA
jgi:glyoxylase-like metal-dependent hydrolase (beta-lactamase superfamily II)